jgi:hypothetical protein
MKNQEHTIFDYKGLIYYRRRKFYYHEQFGRLIFEFIVLGKEVHFIDDPFLIEDGLTDYLRHYEIEFDKRKIITSSNKLIQKMEEPYETKPWD